MTTVSPRAARAPLSRRGRCTTSGVDEKRGGTESLADRLDRDDVLVRDVADVHVGAEVLDEPHLLGLAGRLEDDPPRVDVHLDLVDEPGLDLARRVIDAD